MFPLRMLVVPIQVLVFRVFACPRLMAQEACFGELQIIPLFFLIDFPCGTYLA